MGEAAIISNTTTRIYLMDRQRLLLALLDALGGHVDKLDYQKLLFLYCQEIGNANIYEFVPYRFGAFSFTSYADCRKLLDRGFLAEEAQTWRLTEEGSRIVCDTPNLRIFEFAKRLASLRGDALIAEAYRRFPYYAIRSEISERILKGDKDALNRIDSAHPKQKAASLSTIGYEGMTFENYLNSLIRAGISILCDVRRNPISRKYGFSKSTLANSCEKLGIRYKHMPELGIASEKRRNLNTQADYDALFADYKANFLVKEGEALSKIQEWISSGERVALTCFERSPNQCHRQCVADVLQQNAQKQFRIEHL